MPNSKRSVKYTGVGTMEIFDESRRLSRKRYEIGPWLLWNVNKKTQVTDRYVSVPMTLSDPNPDFKVTVQLQVEYLKNGSILWTKLL